MSTDTKNEIIERLEKNGFKNRKDFTVSERKATYDYCFNVTVRNVNMTNEQKKEISSIENLLKFGGCFEYNGFINKKIHDDNFFETLKKDGFKVEFQSINREVFGDFVITLEA